VEEHENSLAGESSDKRVAVKTNVRKKARKARLMNLLTEAQPSSSEEKDRTSKKDRGPKRRERMKA